MNLFLKSFPFKLTLFSIFSLGLLFLWKTYASERFQSDFMFVLWLFFVVSTALIHYLLMKVSENEPKRFVGFYLGLTGIKLLAYLFIIMIYALLKREAALGFTLWFLVLYFMYSGFEVVMLLKQFKK
jgi:hypothetical protein